MTRLPQVLADLVAGLGAGDAALYRESPGSDLELVCMVGTSAMPATLPPLADGEMAQQAERNGHLASAAADALHGRLILAVRRPAPFDAAECRAIRATVTALAQALP
jgi:hypothetical protein